MNIYFDMVTKSSHNFTMTDDAKEGLRIEKLKTISSARNYGQSCLKNKFLNQV